MFKPIIFLKATFLFLPVFADFTGTVVKVTDGDTINVLNAETYSTKSGEPVLMRQKRNNSLAESPRNSLRAWLPGSSFLMNQVKGISMVGTWAKSFRAAGTSTWSS